MEDPRSDPDIEVRILTHWTDNHPPARCVAITIAGITIELSPAAARTLAARLVADAEALDQLSAYERDAADRMLKLAGIDCPECGSPTYRVVTPDPATGCLVMQIECACGWLSTSSTSK